MSSGKVAPNTVGSLEEQGHKRRRRRRPRTPVLCTCRQDLELELGPRKCIKHPARSTSTARFGALATAAGFAAAGPGSALMGWWPSADRRRRRAGRCTCRAVSDPGAALRECTVAVDVGQECGVGSRGEILPIPGNRADFCHVGANRRKSCRSGAVLRPLFSPSRPGEPPCLGIPHPGQPGQHRGWVCGRSRPHWSSDMSTEATPVLTHGLLRASPEGEPYVGWCVWCGEEGLPEEAETWPCQAKGMRCGNCERVIPRLSNFCGYCGHPTGAKQES